MRPSKSLPIPHPTRILIVRTGAMGDILHALPAVTALRNLLPGAFLGWAVEPHWLPLLSASPGQSRGPHQPLVDRIHPVPTRQWKRRPLSLTTAREIAALRRDLRLQQYDLAVDLQGSIRSAIVGRMASAPRLIGPAHPRERPAAWLYSEHPPTPALNVIRQAAELLSGALGHPLEPAPVTLPVDHAAETWYETLGTPPGFILLLPGAGWGAKRWPIENFAALARSLTTQGHQVLVNSGSATAGEFSGTGASLVNSSVAELIALTRRAALAIGGDTGPLHLAAALGRPVVALFGPTNPARNGPEFPGARSAVLRSSLSVTSHQRTGKTEAGLAGITVEEVFAAARTMLTSDQLAHG